MESVVYYPANQETQRKVASSGRICTFPFLVKLFGLVIFIVVCIRSETGRDVNEFGGVAGANITISYYLCMSR